MTQRAPRWRNTTSSILPVATAACAIGIFIADMFTRMEVAVAVLYVVVVLMAAACFQVRGVLLVSLGCVGLTLLGFFLAPPSGPEATGVINTCLSLLAIGLTTFLVLRNQSAEEAMRRAQTDLAHLNRVTTMGELTASLAHEVNQPISAAITDANTCLRWLARDNPDLEEAREAALRIVKDATRAADIVSRIRLLFKKGTPQRELVDVNNLIREMVVLLRSEATRHAISVRTELAAELPQAMGDHVQLQQVLMNLMLNGIDAMKDMNAGRELAIQSQQAEKGQLLISVSDTGVGLPLKQADQIFNAFFTTKVHGTGMGLAISRSIVESHGGRLWAADLPRGARFHFTLPTKVEAHE
jgi:C4-dicarboxylate-specific signal transduction histidine kinase